MHPSTILIEGALTPLAQFMLAARVGSAALLPTLLSLSPAPNLLSAKDTNGNTALHYASAYGHLKCIRLLLQEGASPGARNSLSWTPVSYSSTVAAEVYFRNLIGEIERRREGEREREREIGRRREGGVRVVGEDVSLGDGEVERGPLRRWAEGRMRAGSAE